MILTASAGASGSIRNRRSTSEPGAEHAAAVAAHRQDGDPPGFRRVRIESERCEIVDGANDLVLEFAERARTGAAAAALLQRALRLGAPRFEGVAERFHRAAPERIVVARRLVAQALRAALRSGRGRTGGPARRGRGQGGRGGWCWRSASGASASRRDEGAPLGFDHVPDRRREIGAAEPAHRADAGRRGDVDFGQEAVDHVDADEHEAAPLQLRADARADFALARRSARSPWRAPPRTMLERMSSSAGTRLTAPSGSPSTSMMRLSPRGDRGQEFLDHPRLAEGGGEQVEQRAEIRCRGRRP